MTAPHTQCQPEITLVQDLRMDADMLKDGHQKNLSELWHSYVVREAAKNALRAADRIEELTGLARFLLDRLAEFDPGDYDAERDFSGHVCPAIARLASAISLESRGDAT